MGVACRWLFSCCLHDAECVCVCVRERALVFLLERKKVKSLSRFRLFATPWAVAYQPPPSMGFSGQEYWSGLPFPSPGDLPNPGMEPRSPALQADTLTAELPGKPQHYIDDTKIQRTWNLIIEKLFKLVTTQIPTLLPKCILDAREVMHGSKATY